VIISNSICIKFSVVIISVNKNTVICTSTSSSIIIGISISSSISSRISIIVVSWIINISMDVIISIGTGRNKSSSSSCIRKIIINLIVVSKKISKLNISINEDIGINISKDISVISIDMDTNICTGIIVICIDIDMNISIDIGTIGSFSIIITSVIISSVGVSVIITSVIISSTSVSIRKNSSMRVTVVIWSIKIITFMVISIRKIRVTRSCRQATQERVLLTMRDKMESMDGCCRWEVLVGACGKLDIFVGFRRWKIVVGGKLDIFVGFRRWKIVVGGKSDICCVWVS
jgi:hypothetical protein